MVAFLTFELIYRHKIIPSFKIGAGYGIRTRDFQLGKLTLYQLS
jgi:hypothetical protein